MSICYKKTTYLFTGLIIALALYSCNQEVSISPPDKLPPDGYILVESTPAGAHIFLNGKDTRRITPDSLTFLSTGTYNFTLKKNLFRDTNFVSDVIEGERKVTLIDYTKNPLMLGEINCNSFPKGAQIFLNDSATGKVTPTVLKQLIPGAYTIRYHFANHQDSQDNVIVQSSKTSAINLTLVDTTAWQVFNTTNSPIKSNDLTCIVTDNNNNLWIGTENQGLLEYDGHTWKQTMPYDHLPDNLPDNTVHVITVEANGDIWVGTRFGVLIITSAGFERYNSTLGQKPFIDPTMRDIKTKPNGKVYIVTDSTFFIEEKIPVYPYRNFEIQNDDYYSKYGHFSSVEMDNNNYYWLGTVSKGVFRYNLSFPGKDFFNTTTTTEIGDSITAIALSKTGTIWVGYKWSVVAASGLSYYNGSSFKSLGVIPFNKNTNSIYIDDTNKKWIGTTGGLVVFDDASNTQVYDKETTGLNIDDVRGVTKDQQGRIWIATHGGGLILKKK